MAFSGYEVDKIIGFEPLIDGEFYCKFPNDTEVNLLTIGEGLVAFPAKELELSLGEPVIDTIELQDGLSYHIPTKITNVKTLSMTGLESHKNDILAFMMKWILNADLEAMRVPDMSKYQKSIFVYQYSLGVEIFKGEYSVIPDASMAIKLSASFDSNIVTKPMSFYITETHNQYINGKSFKPFS